MVMDGFWLGLGWGVFLCSSSERYRLSLSLSLFSMIAIL